MVVPGGLTLTLNDYFLSLLLGVVEGLTEFLPVSSTAHLRIAEALVGIELSNGYWKMFTIVIQFGAILCLPIYFRHRISEFFKTFPRGIRGDRTAFQVAGQVDQMAGVRFEISLVCPGLASRRDGRRSR